MGSRGGQGRSLMHFQVDGGWDILARGRFRTCFARIGQWWNTSLEQDSSTHWLFGLHFFTTSHSPWLGHVMHLSLYEDSDTREPMGGHTGLDWSSIQLGYSLRQSSVVDANSKYGNKNTCRARYSSVHPSPVSSDFHPRDLLNQKDGFLFHKFISQFLTTMLLGLLQEPPKCT